jgi:hypothetical protein
VSISLQEYQWQKEASARGSYILLSSCGTKYLIYNQQCEEAVGVPSRLLVLCIVRHVMIERKGTGSYDIVGYVCQGDIIAYLVLWNAGISQ